MRVLTDDPALAATFIADTPTERWQRNGYVPPPGRALLDALGGAVVWSRDVQPGHPFWRTIVFVSHLDVSQFDALTQVTREMRPLTGPVASLALSSSAFRGQRGRSWAAAPGNLHVSVAVPADVSTAHVGAGLSMLPALAALDAIEAATDGALRPRIKWVNDIVVGDRGERKVGGVLTAAHATGRHVDTVIWGLGINVAVTPTIAPTPFVPAATCIHAELGSARVTVERLFWALLDALAARFVDLARFGASAVFPAYRRHSLVIGRAVKVWDEADCADADPARWGRPLAEGVVAEIADDLSLRLERHGALVSKGRLALCTSSGIGQRVMEGTEPQGDARLLSSTTPDLLAMNRGPKP